MAFERDLGDGWRTELSIDWPDSLHLIGPGGESCAWVVYDKITVHADDDAGTSIPTKVLRALIALADEFHASDDYRIACEARDAQFAMEDAAQLED
jgi:hypothetical protein